MTPTGHTTPSIFPPDLPRGSVAIVLGTRPEIVKLGPIIERLGSAAFVIHTGQHYDADMSEVFLRDFGLAEPDVVLSAGGLTRAAQIAHILDRLDEIFAAGRFQAVVVQGDTNSTVAGALAANAHGLPLVHVEAGLRSNDRAMPEEHNRIVVDHLADVLCAATSDNVRNLLREGLPQSRIALTGNTVVEAVIRQLPQPDARLDLLAVHGLRPDRYVLATIHRPENTDDPTTLRTILRELVDLPVPVVFPIHPRTRAAAIASGCGALLDELYLMDPVSSGTFLALAAHAAVLVSDSGGVQEEVTVLKRPLVVVRRSTERPEAMVDFATLVDAGPQIGESVTRILTDHEGIVSRLRGIPSPFGDEEAAQRVVEALVAITSAAPQVVAG